MSGLAKRLVRLSAVLQFCSGKASLLFSTVTMATVLSMKFHWYWPFVLGGVVLLGLIGVFMAVKSGWYAAECEYVGKKMGVDAKDSR